ncbi:MAG: hypothetical protein MUE90_06815 [Thermoanaerobaculales bacterium]|nr:hypothetical protein [Thermoanaerobaculales bacterium]
MSWLPGTWYQGTPIRPGDRVVADEVHLVRGQRLGVGEEDRAEALGLGAALEREIDGRRQRSGGLEAAIAGPPAARRTGGCVVVEELRQPVGVDRYRPAARFGDEEGVAVSDRDGVAAIGVGRHDLPTVRHRDLRDPRLLRPAAAVAVRVLEDDATGRLGRAQHGLGEAGSCDHAECERQCLHADLLEAVSQHSPAGGG